MDKNSTKHYCSNCQTELSGSDEKCFNCGSKIKEVRMFLQDKFTIHNEIRTKSKRRLLGKDKVIREEKIGDDYHKKSKKWNFLHRIIDRLNDRYYELITDGETGDILKKTDEKLSQHQGHGSAKYKKRT